MCRRLQLLVIHGEQVGLGLLDIEEHFFAELLCLFNPIELLLIDLLKSEGFLVVKFLLQVFRVLHHPVFFLQIIVYFRSLLVVVHFCRLPLLGLHLVIFIDFSDLLFIGCLRFFKLSLELAYSLLQLNRLLISVLLLLLRLLLVAIEVFRDFILSPRQFPDLCRLIRVSLLEEQVTLLDGL